MVFKFNTARAVSYANCYAQKGNPFYKQFERGEDCNFVSQCLFAGCENFVNPKSENWFYKNESQYSTSWCSPEVLKEFLLTTKIGPFGRMVGRANLSVGDLVFFSSGSETGVGIITKVAGDDVFYATKNEKFKENRLEDCVENGCKFLHIVGVKK